MKNLLLIIFLLQQFELIAQKLPERPFEKIVYPELIPEWHFTNYDIEMDNGIFDGYNNFTSIAGYEPLIVDNSIFELFFRQNTNEPTGSYIQKRSLDDGQLKWRKYIGYPLDTQQILARNLLINAYGNLEVLCQVKCDPYDINYPLLGRKNMALYKLELNTNSGDVINEINYYCNDTTYIQTNFDGFYLKDVSKCYAINDTFYFTQSEWTGSNWQRVIYKLKENLKIENVKASRFPKKYNCYGDLPIFFNDSTRIVFNSNCNTKQLEMSYIDNNFNEIRTIITDTLSKKLNELQVKKFDKTNRRFLLENVINFDTREIELIVIDDKGQLLKRIIMPNTYNRNYCILEWENIDSLLFLAPRSHNTNTNKSYVTLDVLTSNKNGNINVSHSFLPSDSLRFLSYLNLVTSSDKEYYYLEINESSLKKSQIKYEIDFNASSKSMLKLEKNLILKPITKTNSLRLNKISCFPNPTSGQVQIGGASHPTFLRIYNLNGKFIKTYPNVTNQVSVDELSSGVYIFEFKNKNIIERQKIIIIK